MTPLARTASCAGLGAALLLGVSSALAGQTTPAPARSGVTLEWVVARALTANPDVLAAAAQLDASEGRRLAAGAPFEAVASTQVQGGQTYQVPTALGTPFIPTSSMSYEFSFSKRLRSGFVLQPDISVQSTGVRGLAAPPTNQASVGLTVLVPLLKDRLGHLSVAGERAATVLNAGDQRATVHATAVAVVDAVTAYWQYLAAAQRLDVQAGSEARARRLADETRVLVRAEERSAADLNQVLANLASKRVARASAEQALLQARAALAAAIGAEPGELSTLPPPADSFPTPQVPRADSSAAQALARAAQAARGDLASARAQTRAADILSAAAENDLRPRLDLSLNLGYQTLQAGDGFERFLAPLYRQVPGPDASLRLEYRFPVNRLQERGVALQRTAELDQARIRQAAAERQVALNVAVDLDAVRRSALAADDARDAVALYLATVDAQKKESQLGMATLFDVIIAEDNLTTALLQQVSTRLGYAVALAQLRLETGMLVGGSASRPSVAVAALLSPP